MFLDFVLVPTPVEGSSGVPASPSFFFDAPRARRQLAAASAGGFGAVVVDDRAGPLSSFDIVADVARWAPSLDIAMTHRAGPADPALAAADIAALDRLTGGRLALRMVVEGRPDSGEPHSHRDAWQRADEYLTLLKRLWSNARAIDHEGPFYRLHDALVADKGPRGAALPIRLSGCSGTAAEVSARHATVFELPLGSYADNVALMERVRAAAGRCGRSGKIRFAALVDAHEDWFRWGAAALSRYVAAGVTEFVVCGLADAAAIDRFASEVIRPLARMQERLRAALPANILRLPNRLP